MSDAGAKPRPFETHTLEQMAAQLDAIDRELKERLIRRAEIGDELAIRYGTQLAALRANTDKNTASLTIDGIKVVGEVKKDVKYDGAALKTIAAPMSWEQVQAVFKIDFSVSEVSYKALQTAAALNPESKVLFDAITGARTVEYKPQAVKIERAKA